MTLLKLELKNVLSGKKLCIIFKKIYVNYYKMLLKYVHLTYMEYQLGFIGYLKCYIAFKGHIFISKLIYENFENVYSLHYNRGITNSFRFPLKKRKF